MIKDIRIKRHIKIQPLHQFLFFSLSMMLNFLSLRFIDNKKTEVLLFLVAAWNLSYSEVNMLDVVETKIKECKETEIKTPSGNAYWKYRGLRFSTSEGVLCWKENETLLFRECNTHSGRWLPESVTCKTRDEPNTFCPNDLLEIMMRNDNPVCLKISPHPHQYDDAYCHGSNVIIPLDLSVPDSDLSIAVTKFLSSKGINRFWLPLKRNDTLPLYKVRLPGTRWSEIFEGSIEIADLRSNKNCLSTIVVHNQKNNSHQNRHTQFINEVTHCNELIHSVCIFRKKLLSRTGCKENFGALSYRPAECYGLEWNHKSRSRSINALNVNNFFEKRNVLQLIFRDLISKSRRNEFFEVESFADEADKVYVVLMNRKEEFKILHKNNDNEFPLISEEIVPITNNLVTMILKFNVELQQLVLIVYNSRFIWRIEEDDENEGIRCFTNADYKLLSRVKIDHIWENDDKTKSIFKLKVEADDPGEYWCEAHTIFNFDLISSQKVVASKIRRGHAFAMQFDVPCHVSKNQENLCTNFHRNAKKLSKNVLRLFRKDMLLEPKSFHDLVIHNVRIMKLQYFSMESVNCWIHVTASLRTSAVDNSEEESSEENNSLEDSDRIRHDTSIRMRVWQLITKLVLQRNVQIVRSTEYCFPERFYMNGNVKNQWLQSNRGQVATTLFLCLLKNGMPQTRLCKGDFIEGAYWKDIMQPIFCELNLKGTEITARLHNLENFNLKQPGWLARDIKNIIKGRLDKIVSADLYLISKIMQESVKYITHLIDDQFRNATTSLTETIFEETRKSNNTILTETVCNFIDIYNYLMNVKLSTFKESLKLNSTNRLLEAFEKTIDKVTSVRSYEENIWPNDLKNENDLEFSDYVDIGVSVTSSNNFLCFVIDPLVSNISGVAIFQDAESQEPSEMLTGAFKHEYYRFLQANHTYEDFVNDPHLQMGTFIPDKLLNRLNEISEMLNVTQKRSPVIIIKIYSSDRLFQELSTKKQIVSGRIVSISIPGFNTELPDIVPIALHVSPDEAKNKNDSIELCHYWNFRNWVTDGITFLGKYGDKNNIILCGCSHLTPFAYLVGGGPNISIDVSLGASYSKIHEKALDVITIVGCSLSLMGISGILITAVLFSSWRRKASSKVLIQLALGIALQMIIILVIEEPSLHFVINKILPSCIVIGACLHYSVLVQFFWIMIIAYLQFQRYVQVFAQNRPKRFFMKSTIFCWGLPLIPVVLVILFDKETFVKGKICYPSGYALYFGIIAPIAIIIMANFIIYCLVIYNITRGPGSQIRRTDKSILVSQIRLSVLLFFLLGLTWGFGLLSIMKIGLVFSYLFCLTATLQGFVMFVYFIILDPVTRRFWINRLSQLFGVRKFEFQSATSSKDTTQTSQQL